MLNKTLVIIFVFLSLLIGTEVVILNQKLNSNNDNMSTVNGLKKPTQNFIMNGQVVTAINENTQGILVQSVLTNEYAGITTEFDTKGGSTATNYKYKAKISLKNNSSNMFSLYFKAEDLEKLEVFINQKNNKIKSNIANLKVGQRITITVRNSLINNFDFISGEIIIL